jgi:ureidoacrylate peracid hydrolase
VIDMQNGFCVEEGSLAGDASQCARYQTLVPGLQLLSGRARDLGVRVIYTRHGYRPGYPEMGHELTALHPEVVRGNGMQWESWDTQVLDELAPREQDLVVRKSRFDAFLGTDLDLLLDAGRVRRLVVAGISTNVCVESTVRSAAQRGYDVGVASDATAATTPSLHKAALDAMAYAFATVAPGQRLLDRASSGRQHPAPVAT